MTGIPAGSYRYDDGLSIGAQVLSGGVFFRVWAPKASRVEAVVEGKGFYSLATEGRGYFSVFASSIKAGDLYRYRLDGEKSYSDPASRFQPEGPDGPSEAIDPGLFPWTDSTWPGVSLKGQVIYELHIGTFTKEGTWEAAARELWELKDFGVTLVELMPVADFPGRFGWGYDGVNLYAPTRLYGRPDGLRAFVDRAHSIGLGVILDVVYNHTGPEGCVLSNFSRDYFTDRYENEWGKAVNFDGEGSQQVREFFIENARYWIREFHMDGLRLDATQMIFDDGSRSHILAELTEAVKNALPGRAAVVIAENEPQDTRLIASPEEGGFGIDALWNDDFHHSAHVAMTGRAEAYYLDYLGKPQELVSSIKWGYLYQGQRYMWQGKRRGTPSLRIEPLKFVNYLQNHDQVANSVTGLRARQLTSPGRLRALTALLLLAPSTPLIFQGQEFASSSPFLYFCDLEDGIMEQVRGGRKEFLRQFKSIAGLEDSELPDPGDPATFERCKLDTAERLSNRAVYDLHKDLLRIRREDSVISLQTGEVDGAVVSSEAFLIRFFGGHEDRLLAVNLGPDLSLQPCPEPLLAPERGKSWNIIFSSEHPRYGGSGTPLFNEAEWAVPGHSALLLAPVERP